MALTRPRAYQIYDLDYKQATRVVTITNITLAGGAPNSVDGVTLSLNDRILVTGQTSGSQNGVYYVTTLGTGSNGTWARSTDTNNTGELLSGTIIMVTEGVIYADTQWKLITNDPIVIGTTPLTFVQNYSANSISSGTSNVTILSNSSVLISSAGIANVAKFDSTNITFTANLLPVSNVTYSLGTTSQRWKDIWLSNSTIYLGNVNLSASATALTVNGANVLTGNSDSVFSTSGNIVGGNILTGGYVSATGNITGNYIIGNGSQLTGLPASYSNTNVSSFLAAFGSNTISTTGTITAGNITGGNLLTGGLVSSSSNITGGNILTGGIASATGNIIGGNILTAGLLSVTGNITGGNIIGGANVNATTLTGTTVSVSANITGGNILTGGLISATSTITGSTLLAGGISLTGNSITSTNSTITIDPNSAGGVDGAVVIAGNLSVQGNVTYIDSNVITTNEKSITLGNNQNTGTALDGAGIDIGNNNLAYWRFNNATTSWQSNIGLTPAANATLNLGGTSNYWATLYTNAVQSGTTVSAVSNIAGGNILTAGLISATSNITGGNVLTSGQLSATGTITSNGATNGTAFVVGNSAVSNVALGMFPTAGTAGEYAIRDYSNVATNMYLDVGVGGTANGSFRFRTTNAFTTLANINSTGITTPLAVSATGNITGNYFIGNGSQLTGIVASAGAAITNGTSNVVVAASGNVTVGVAGTAAVATFTTTGIVANSIAATNNGNATNFKVGDDAWLGDINTVDTIGIRGQQNAANAYIVFGNADSTQLGRAGSGPLTYGGAFSATGNITGGNLLFGTGIVSGTGNVFANNLTGTLQTASQTNITSVGTLGALTVTANITGGNILTGGLISATGNITTAGIMSSTGNAIHGNILTAGLISATSTITSAANIIGGNILTAGIMSSTGNAIHGNILTGGLISATSTITSAANIIGGNILTAGIMSSTANAIHGNILTGGLISATSNITGGNILTAGIMSSTANAIHGNILTGGLISATSNITGGNILFGTGIVSGTGNVFATNLTGTLQTAAQPNITSVGTLTNLSVTNSTVGSWITQITGGSLGNTAGNQVLLSRWTTFNSNSNYLELTETRTSAGSSWTTSGTRLQEKIDATWMGFIQFNGTNTNGGITFGTGTSTANATAIPDRIYLDSSGNFYPAAANAQTLGSSANWWSTVYGKAVQAQYADLAEMYAADEAYPAGTVVVFGGDKEITISTESHDTRVAGIVSTDPAYLMNSSLDSSNPLEIALVGRVPCQVVGTIRKGDRLVASGLYPGVATGLNKESYEPGCIIGKALEDYSSTEVGTIEVAVGRF
jgi:filamentous hemagglutinin